MAFKLWERFSQADNVFQALRPLTFISLLGLAPFRLNLNPRKEVQTSKFSFFAGIVHFLFFVLCFAFRKGGRFHNRVLLSDQYHQIQRWNPTPDWHPGHVHYFWLCHVQETTFGQHNTEQHSGGRDICEAGHEVGLPQDTVVQLSHILGHAAVQRHLLVCELQPAGQCHHIALICDFHNLRPAAHQYQPDGLQVSLHHGLGQEPV